MHFHHKIFTKMREIYDYFINYSINLFKTNQTFFSKFYIMQITPKHARHKKTRSQKTVRRREKNPVLDLYRKTTIPWGLLRIRRRFLRHNKNGEDTLEDDPPVGGCRIPRRRPHLRRGALLRLSSSDPDATFARKRSPLLCVCVSPLFAG